MHFVLFSFFVFSFMEVRAIAPPMVISKNIYYEIESGADFFLVQTVDSYSLSVTVLSSETSSRFCVHWF